jgi:hypothetical protein
MAIRFLVVDRDLAEAWRVQLDDYERFVVDALERGEAEIAIGDSRGVLLGHEAGEGILEVFRLGEHDLLAPIVS